MSEHFQPKNQTTTMFGSALARASQKRDATFLTDTSRWAVSYQDNSECFDALRQLVQAKAGVLIAGAGKQAKLPSYQPYLQNWLRTGVHWTNFNPDIDISVIASTHVAPLEASLFSSRIPDYLIHGVYSKVPPCLLRSCTVRWSDPFLNKSFNGSPSAHDLDALIHAKSFGVAPYLPAVRNTLFFTATVALWLGAHHIVFTAVDPMNPEYFFTGNPDLTLEIVRCVASANPWLAEWDGRNERLGIVKRDTSHRVQHFISNLLKQRSAVGGSDYLFEFDRGFNLLRQLCDLRGAQLGYIGDSKYMSTTGIPRLA